MQRYTALLKIIETGSFTAAARLLGYTQPALSQMIASLESELGIRLLNRSRYGIRLTPEGERLLPGIQSAVSQYEAMRQTADEIRGLESGLVRIGTVSSVSCRWLPGVIRKFWAEHPNIEIALHQGDYTSIQDWVRTGTVDFGFVNPKAVHGLEVADIVRSGEFRAILPAGHALAQRRFLTLTELAAQPLILLEEGAYSEPLEAFRAEGIEPEIRLRAHDDYSILSMVEQGLGVSVLTELVLGKTSYNVAAVPIEPPIIRTMSIVVKDKASLSLASRKFIKCLLDSRAVLP